MEISKKNQIPEEYPAIAHRLRVARGHLSQADAGKALGMHKNTIGNYERGERLPDVVTLAKMCNLYKVDPNWILTGKESGGNTEHSIPAEHIATLEPAQWLVEDVLENSGIELSGKQKQAVIDVLRKYILTQTKGLIMAVQVKNDGHSILRYHNLNMICLRLRAEIGFTDEEFEAWLRANYGISDLYIGRQELSMIAGHLYDIAKEKCDPEKIDSLVFPGLVLRPGDERYDIPW